MATQLSVRPQWDSPYERSFQLRKTLEDSRKAFLNFTEDKENNSSKEEKRPPAKKISFKIKKTSSLYRRKEKISVNTVQELAKKYNDLVEKSEKMRIVVKKEVMRKPSLKKRPSDTKIVRKSSVSRKLISNKEISKLEMEGGVKATIAIFEERIKTPQPGSKPKVPEKTFNAKDVATRNQEKRLKIFEKRLRSFNNNNQEKTDGDFFVQVVNIPLSPPKKCDSKYETMHLRKANLFTKDSNRIQDIQNRVQEEDGKLQTNKSSAENRLNQVQTNIRDGQDELEDRLKRGEEKAFGQKQMKEVKNRQSGEDRLGNRQNVVGDRRTNFKLGKKQNIIGEDEANDVFGNGFNVIEEETNRMERANERFIRDKQKIDTENRLKCVQRKISNEQIDLREDRLQEVSNVGNGKRILSNTTENRLQQVTHKNRLNGDKVFGRKPQNSSQDLKKCLEVTHKNQLNGDKVFGKKPQSSSQDLKECLEDKTKDYEPLKEHTRIVKKKLQRTPNFDESSFEDASNSKNPTTEDLSWKNVLSSKLIEDRRKSIDQEFGELANVSICNDVKSKDSNHDEKSVIKPVEAKNELHYKSIENQARNSFDNSDSLDGVNNSKNLDSKIYEDSKLKIYEDPSATNAKSYSKLNIKRGKPENPKDPRKLIARIIGKRHSEKGLEKRKLSDAKFYDLENSDGSTSSNIEKLHLNQEDLNKKNNALNDKKSDSSVLTKERDLSMDHSESNLLNIKKETSSNNEESSNLSITNGESSNAKRRESINPSIKNEESSELCIKNSESTNISLQNQELFHNAKSSDLNNESSMRHNELEQNRKSSVTNILETKPLITQINSDEENDTQAENKKPNNECEENSTKPKDLIYSRCPEKTKDLIKNKTAENSKLEIIKKFEELQQGAKKVSIASTIQARVKQLELVDTKNTHLKRNELNKTTSVIINKENKKVLPTHFIKSMEKNSSDSKNKQYDSVTKYTKTNITVQNAEMNENARKIYNEILNENLERKNNKHNGHLIANKTTSKNYSEQNFRIEEHDEDLIKQQQSEEVPTKRNLIRTSTIEERDVRKNNPSVYETLEEVKASNKNSDLDYEKCVYEKSETLDDYEECADENYKKYTKTYELNSTKKSDSENCVQPDWEDLYDFVDVNIKPSTPSPISEQPPSIPPRRVKEEKIYEELIHATHDYEDDGYEICESPSSLFPEENIYETLPTPKQPPLLPRRKEEPLPPRPPSRNSCMTHENESNFYESIYSKKEEDVESTYESIYGCRIGLDQWKSKRDSLISEQQSNSIYNRSITSWAEEVFDYAGKNGSEISGSDRSDDWVDMSDNEDAVKNSGFIILRPKVGKRVSGWSQQMRDQWNKIPRNTNLDHGDSDSDHHYETLSALNNPIATTDIQDDEFDSFDSDSESDNSFAKNDSGVDMGNTQLPEPPNQQTYVHRLAATAGKHMKKLRNWTLTKNDITKTLGRMTKRKSRTDLDGIDKIMEEKPAALSLPQEYDPSLDYQEAKSREPATNAYQNVQYTSQENQTESSDKTKSLGRKGFLNKFRRSMSISGDTPELSLTNGDKAKSTFYLTETIDVDKKEEEKESEVPVVNLSIKNKTSPTRPRVPPPPAPKQSSPNLDMKKKNYTKRATSWYSECGVFKNAEPPPVLPRRPNTFWYAEVGLYRSTNSTPSTSSTENSGSLTNVIIKPIQEDNDDYYNVKNENDYYNGSIQSSDSYDTKKDEAFNSLPGDLQLRLQDEPLYQFYDAAVLESVCKDGTTDYEYDGYEEVGKKNSAEVRMSTRPSAMELVTPKRNNVSVARTLWCEIPEVVQSTVLSTLSLLQKKLQEAKFEMLTSEASYLNSLNVLADHFIKTFETCDFLNQDEKDILFGKVIPVKECSEKLLMELEKCWQDNILLHGICDIVKKHAEENFYVYVSYCENQILLDRTLRKLKERPGFVETLKQLESSTVCHLLTLHSFLMLPMQRVTRWPLLLDAVLKRLSHQDEEYLSCQYALATLNKIVNQCNEGARRMERVTEMKKIASQMEFGKGVTPISLVTGSRWLVRSGPLIQMQARGEDVKLTFGKRFSKVPLHLFLFNDILIVAKSRGDETYSIQHYCYRSYLEINSENLSCLPLKDTQGRHLIFLTILENHEEKTIELLLSCNSETDKERWLEALSPPKSENPDETLYECWDCPQVTVVHTYTANQPDELALSRGDIINVTRKMADGWYHGERIRDGETGWFPANYTVEVANPHVRARNLKQRYRLLAFSESYLKSK